MVAIFIIYISSAASLLGIDIRNISAYQLIVLSIYRPHIAPLLGIGLRVILISQPLGYCSFPIICTF